jgi:hypothetical protein
MVELEEGARDPWVRWNYRRRGCSGGELPGGRADGVGLRPEQGGDAL